MKADNIFRFVSIRPPGDNETIEHVPGDEGAIDEVGTLLAATSARRGTTRGDAAKATGSEIINGPDYVRSRGWGAKLLALTPEVRRVLRQARETPDWKAFQQEAQTVVSPLTSSSSKMTPEAFLNSDAFPDMERTLWRSYFATVLSAYERPKDAESLATWLVFLHLLKSTTADEFSKRAKRGARTRPAVPASFFFNGSPQPGDAQHAPPPPASDPSTDAAKEVRDEIARLASARRDLNELFAERARPTVYAVRSGPIETAEIVGVPKAKRTRRAAATGGESSQVAAWKLTPDDFRNRERLIETVRAAGIIPELSTIPDAINRLDTRIAELNATLAQMDSVRDVAIVGKTFVRRRRPVAPTIREVP
jgi:hypothetical protein